ncbi:hypothetical protein [Cyclobacterium salsum]|uniref:hypothetical protein n=1 Tax=Cyclobacterium salsum TaxID=2666329 RepID=UPI00192EC40F|nr:hypothetical protein [Cyclobacterium salsum]
MKHVYTVNPKEAQGYGGDFLLVKFKMRLFLLLLTLAFVVEGFSQADSKAFTAKNAVYLEVGGNAGRYAASYARIFHQKGKFKLSASAGFSMWRDDRSELPYNTSKAVHWLPTLPLEISALFGRSSHHLEMGTGIMAYLTVIGEQDQNTSQFRDKVTLDAVVPLRVGYRYQKPEGGFFFRVGYTPFISLDFNNEGFRKFIPLWGGISLGKSF